MPSARGEKSVMSIRGTEVPIPRDENGDGYYHTKNAEEVGGDLQGCIRKGEKVRGRSCHWVLVR